MPLKRNAMPLAECNIDDPGRNAIPMPGMASVARAERYTDAGAWLRWPGRNAIPMPGRGLDDPGAERYATG